MLYTDTVQGGAGYLETRLTDAAGHTTRTLSDVWGRAAQVIPPTGPSVSYTYDIFDRLVNASRGGATTILIYDKAGRKTQMSDPDMGVWYYSYNALGSLTQQTDARTCTTALTYDLLNRLTGKSYSGCAATTNPTYTYDDDVYQELFNGASLPSGWAGQGSVSVSGGQVHLTNPNYGTWSTWVIRNDDQAVMDGQVVEFVFKLTDQGYAKMQVNAGTSGQANYRRWGLSIQSNAISREECIGTAACTYASLMSLAPGVWYRGQLVIDSSQRFYARVWRVDNPAGVVESWAAHSDWSGMEWKFKNFVLGGTQDLDEYKQSLLYGKGRRTRMTDGSGTTQWSYDNRGQMIAERKVVGSEVFYTRRGYNAAGLPGWIRYPGGNTGQSGERVSYTYHPQMLVNSVVGSDTYVQSSSYDAAGRVDIRLLGDSSGAAILRTDFDYFAWNDSNGNGRLKRIKSEDLYPSLTLLQDLRYYNTATGASFYDAVGNLARIDDYKNGTGTSPIVPQSQYFTYDNLYRVTSAYASGGSGGNGDYTTESYSYYSPSGNLASKTGVGTYDYAAQSSSCAEGALASRPHAVTSTVGATTTLYCYDRNGNMTRRDPSGAAVYNFQYDAESRLTAVSGSATASFVFDGDGNRVKSTAGGVTTVHLGAYFEWTGSTSTMKTVLQRRWRAGSGAHRVQHIELHPERPFGQYRCHHRWQRDAANRQPLQSLGGGEICQRYAADEVHLHRAVQQRG